MKSCRVRCRARVSRLLSWVIVSGGNLEPEAIEVILARLHHYPYGWRQELPAAYRFFGQPVAVTIETRPFPEAGEPPKPADAELHLVRLVLAGLPDVLATAAQEYAAYNDAFPELLRKVTDPRLWVCREFQQQDGPDRWALTSGISDAPDWTIFVEFCGLSFLEVWSGD
jgi:hypothetical protein